MATATLAGSTGLVGSNILNQVLASPSFSAIYAYSRRELPNPNGSTKLNPITSTDNAQWPSLFPRESKPKILLSALGTTRAGAGGLEGQRKIDYELNLELAKAAKDAGVETYVLISSGGASSTSMMAYPRLKGELEEAVKALEFKHTVILRPGLIVGERNESRPAEAVIRGIAKGLRSLTPALTNFWAQDASVIARAAVNAGVQCIEGKKEAGVWELGQADIIALGKA
ncbi:NAD dependent epimerase/dehydratase family protein-like protein [Cucurbitaria berberidis CBS 394.84]|uniref:NAD dependent epimerase/dehydratase family protein-like protein n=1 Tax=Cucurbitaria berberidis CBS 394.84 TaxID=1168544 RepID=A0A9P4LD16_9PLEO|nr:NAD dependent epimerase/dehydratase family protein-like protein [Cucurbitaria berberidis CBS 394.84]KAF1850283.1 NAD dependent epimerase/dehydratase family protein-like protein [Cucurbitaria berberidis CBS 394.84]